MKNMAIFVLEKDSSPMGARLCAYPVQDRPVKNMAPAAGKPPVQSGDMVGQKCMSEST